MVTIVKQKKESLMLEYIKYARCYIHIKPFLFYLSYLVPLSCHNVSDEVRHGLAGTLWLFVQPEKKKWNQDFWPTQIRSTWSTYFWHIQSLLSTLNAATMNSGTFKLREREEGRAVEGIAKSSCQDYLAIEKEEAPQMVFRLIWHGLVETSKGA